LLHDPLLWINTKCQKATLTDKLHTELHERLSSMQYDCNYCTNLVEEDMWELINLCSKPSSSIHDKGPQICTRSYTAYIQAIFIALLHMLSQPWISNIIVVPAVPVLVSGHWNNTISGLLIHIHQSLTTESDLWDCKENPCLLHKQIYVQPSPRSIHIAVTTSQLNWNRYCIGLHKGNYQAVGHIHLPCKEFENHAPGLTSMPRETLTLLFSKCTNS
jgi:hypothetical protein